MHVLTDAEAASIIAQLKFAVPSERAQTSNSDNGTSDNTTCISSDETTSSVSSDESTSSDDDDVVVYEGREYAYHPPSVGDVINVLCPPAWYSGKITSIKKSRANPYKVVFYRTSISRSETYLMSLDIEDYPSKWHFIDD